ncbi:MAG: polyprenyl synthetase family protein [Alphaproteobacteria bacterium]|nr:polyprenyl synthetase family protein [Alphaproteobacteria bacterium]
MDDVSLRLSRPTSFNVTPQPDTSSARALVLSSIKAALPKNSAPLGQAALHHFEDTGKMLRAGLALATGQALKINPETCLNWATAIEVMHNASLVHDDISDGDTLRRDRPSIWAAFGRDTALALGDWLIGLSFEFAAKAAVSSRSPELVTVLSYHMKDTTSGQAMEFELTHYPEWNDYLKIIRGKTAPLFIAPVEGMARVAGRDDLVKPVADYFNAVGTAYQVANDILNILGEDGALSPASDLIRRAPNGVIVSFRNTLMGDDAEDFDRWLATGDHHGAHHWHERILSSSAISITCELMRGILRDAERKASTIPDELSHIVEPVQKLLTSVCEQSIQHAAE